MNDTSYNQPTSSEPVPDSFERSLDQKQVSRHKLPQFEALKSRFLNDESGYGYAERAVLAAARDIVDAWYAKEAADAAGSVEMADFTADAAQSAEYTQPTQPADRPLDMPVFDREAQQEQYRQQLIALHQSDQLNAQLAQPAYDGPADPRQRADYIAQHGRVDAVAQTQADDVLQELYRPQADDNFHLAEAR